MERRKAGICFNQALMQDIIALSGSLMQAIFKDSIFTNARITCIYGIIAASLLLY